MRLQDFLSYKDKFQKVKKVKEKPSLKQVKQRTANIIVYGLLVLFVLVGLLGSLRALGLSNQVSSLQKQVVDFQKIVEEVPSDNQSLDVSKVRQYMFDFMKVYINYSNETASERMTALANYYSFNPTENPDSIKEEQNLTGQNVIAISPQDDFYVADVKVSYETIENGQKVSYLRVLSVPFKTENGLFSIISPPFFKQEDVLTGQAEPFLRKKTEDVERVDQSVEKSVREFLPIFFDKYALSNETDLALLMKEPYLMGGQYTVQEINDSSVLVYSSENGQTAVQLSVVFADKAGSTHTEHFTLSLVKQDSGWFVDELYHYFK